VTSSKGSFRVGRVRADLRGSVWYLCYSEHGRRHRPRVGPDRRAARRMAAQINAQLESGAPAALSFEPIGIDELQRRWLANHEHVLRSSLQTIRRYRAATNHLIGFVNDRHRGCRTSVFGVTHAEDFVRYLRTVQVAPNGHANARKRPLLDKGIQFILETCRCMFRYTIKRRHLSPYAENPFSELELDRLPIENSKPVHILTPDLEGQLLEACDDWQFPVFLTLMLTGLRPGELTHLLLPEDLDLESSVLRISNKPRLHWQVKTRNEREIPLVPVLVDVLRLAIGARSTGPVFQRRRFVSGGRPLLAGKSQLQLENELVHRTTTAAEGDLICRAIEARVARCVWRDAGMIKSERIRTEFMRLTRSIGVPEITAPKSLRHGFATSMQDANVDPIVRCELMGHSTGACGNGNGLGMTATYTHTRPETKRAELIRALSNRRSHGAAERWLRVQLQR